MSAELETDRQVSDLAVARERLELDVQLTSSEFAVVISDNELSVNRIGTDLEIK